MKSTKAAKTLSFTSISSPCDFIREAKDEAFNSNLKFEPTDSGFDLEIGGNHGGKLVYRATVSATEGGSLISGQIITIPWSARGEKENLFQKILFILGVIIILPLILLSLLSLSIYTIFSRLFCRKGGTPTEEDVLRDFMIDKMCCNETKEHI